MCLEIYEVDPAKFLSAPGLAWQATLKKTKLKLYILTDISILLLQKPITNTWKIIIKIKNQYWDVNNINGWAMLQKLPVNNHKWIKNTFQFNEDFIENHNEESDEGYFLEVDVQYLKKLHEVHNDLLFLHDKIKIRKVEMPLANLHDKTEYIIRIRDLKQALNHRLVLEKRYRVISS